MPPLTKKYDNFLRSGPFLMFLGALKRHGHAGHYASIFIKKYSFLEKLQPKTFCDIFFITRFSKNIFSKKWFRKIENFGFSKNHFFGKNMTFQIFRSQKKRCFFENFTFLETSNLDVSRKVKFSKKLFFLRSKILKSHIFSKKWFFEKPTFLISQNYFLDRNFRAVKSHGTSLICCNFSSFQYFLMILDAFDAQRARAFNAPKNIQNR